jgi:hypothetical protein
MMQILKLKRKIKALRHRHSQPLLHAPPWTIAHLVLLLCLLWNKLQRENALPEALCRVPEALGKALKTLGKGFAECDTRQRRLGKQCIGKAFFVEYFFSGIRQRGLPSAREHSTKKSGCYCDG